MKHEALLNFEGFTDHEMDTIVYRKFQPGGAFTQKIDTVLSRMGWSSGQTSFTFSTENIDPEYDYEVSPLGANRTFRISDMTTTTQKCSCGPNDTKRISTCKVDGIATSGDNIILQK